MASNHRRMGLSRETDPNTAISGNVFRLVRRFNRTLVFRKLNPDTKGFFYGIEALRALIAECDTNNYDGIRFLFGQKENPLNEIVIVAQGIQFDLSTSAGDDSNEILSQGSFYTSIGTIATEPPVKNIPPLQL